MFLFGVSYAIASISCALPLFTGAVAGTFRRADLLSSLAVFVAYALGMTLVLLALTVSMGLARQGVLRWLRRAMPYVNRVSGVLLVVVGAYLTHYGWFERRVQDGDARGRAPSIGSPVGPTTSPRGSPAWAPTRLGLLLALGLRDSCWPSPSASAPAIVELTRRRGRFAELLAHDGVEEDLELRSAFGFMAFHGGNLEVGTDVIADAGGGGLRRLALRGAPARRCAGTCRRSSSRPTSRRHWPPSSTTSTWPSPSTATGATACGRTLLAGGGNRRAGRARGRSPPHRACRATRSSTSSTTSRASCGASTGPTR